jgi:hypothetical protein
MSASLRWEHRTRAAHALVPFEGGVAILEDAALGVHDANGARAGEVALSAAPAEGGRRVVRAVDAWLVGGSRDLGLVRLGKAKPTAFAAGDGPIDAFYAGPDAIAIARASGLELWSYANKRKWSSPGGPWTSVVLAGTQVVALSADGALAFAALKSGEVSGTLRLASTEPAGTWRLSTVDSARVALALGDWVVLVDVVTRKVQKRIRVRAKVNAMAADAEWIVVGLEDGWVQAVKVDAAEPRGAFEAHPGEVSAVALGKGALFTAGPDGLVRAWDRSRLAASSRASSPVTAIASRADLVAAGDSSGKVRVLRGEAEVGVVALGEPITAVHLTADAGVVAATAHLVIHAPRPWTRPTPIVLEAPATAFASDDAYVFAGTENGTVDVYDIEHASHVTTYSLSEAAITALVRLRGNLLVVGTGALDGRVFVVDVAAAKVVHRLEVHDEAFGVTSLACDPKGRIVASGSDDGTVVLLDPAKGRILARLRVRETPASLAFDASGRKLGCAFADATAALFTLGPGKASMEDMGLRGAAHVAWGGGPIFGLADGRVERIGAS